MGPRPLSLSWKLMNGVWAEVANTEWVLESAPHSKPSTNNDAANAANDRSPQEQWLFLLEASLGGTIQSSAQNGIHSRRSLPSNWFVWERNFSLIGRVIPSDPWMHPTGQDPLLMGNYPRHTAPITGNVCASSCFQHSRAETNVTEMKQSLMIAHLSISQTSIYSDQKMNRFD